jgi:hypothetical protein
MTRPKDFGDNYPSDLDDVAPVSPTKNFSETSVPIPRGSKREKIARLQNFDPNFQPDVFEKVRHVYMGRIIRKAPPEYERYGYFAYEGFYQDNRWYYGYPGYYGYGPYGYSYYDNADDTDESFYWDVDGYDNTALGSAFGYIPYGQIFDIAESEYGTYYGYHTDPNKYGFYGYYGYHYGYGDYYDWGYGEIYGTKIYNPDFYDVLLQDGRMVRAKAIQGPTKYDYVFGDPCIVIRGEAKNEWLLAPLGSGSYVAKPQTIIPAMTRGCSCINEDCCAADLVCVSINGAKATLGATVNGNPSFVSDDEVITRQYILYWRPVGVGVTTATWVISVNGTDTYFGSSNTRCPLGEFRITNGETTICVTSYNMACDTACECAYGQELLCVEVDGLECTRSDTDINGKPAYTNVSNSVTVSWDGHQWVLVCVSGTFYGGTDDTCPLGVYGTAGPPYENCDGIAVTQQNPRQSKPGVGTCDVYRIDDSAVCGTVMIPVAREVEVYNFSVNPIPCEWTIVHPERYGGWVANPTAVSTGAIVCRVQIKSVSDCGCKAVAQILSWPAGMSCVPGERTIQDPSPDLTDPYRFTWIRVIDVCDYSGCHLREPAEDLKNRIGYVSYLEGYRPFWCAEDPSCTGNRLAYRWEITGLCCRDALCSGEWPCYT